MRRSLLITGCSTRAPATIGEQLVQVQFVGLEEVMGNGITSIVAFLQLSVWRAESQYQGVY